MSRTSTNILANFLGQAWSALLQLALVPIYLRFLGVEAYALVGFYIMLITGVQIFDLGIAQTLNRELAQRSSDAETRASMQTVVRTFEVVYLGLIALVCLLLLLSVPLLAKRVVNADELDDATLRHAIYLMVVVIGLNWPTNLYFSGLMGLQRQVAANYLRILLSSVSSIGAVLTLWLWSPTITAFFSWQIGAGLFSVAVARWVLRRSLPTSSEPVQFSKDILQTSWRFAAGLSGLSVTAILLTQADKWVLINILPLKIFGYYLLGLTVANSLNLVVTPVFNAMYPRLAAIWTKPAAKESAADLYHLATQLVAVLVLPTAAVLSAFSSEVLWIWTRNLEVAEQSATILSVYVAGTALNGLMHMPYALELARGRTRTFLTINVVAILLLIPGIWFLVTWVGPVGAAVFWLGLNAAYFPFALPKAHSDFSRAHQWHWLLRDIAVPALIALAVVLVSRITLPAYHSLWFLGGHLCLTLIAAIILASLSAPSLRRFLAARVGELVRRAA